MPHAIGPTAGEPFRIMNPPHAGSHYYNFKIFYSIVLFAVVDADYKFLYMDMGASGYKSDGGVYVWSRFSELLNTNHVNLPPP